MNYETLDTIADAYVPLLGVICIVLIAQRALVTDWAHARKGVLLLIHGLIVTYGLMVLDYQLGIWPAVGLDYSTHSAIAISLVLVALFIMPSLLWPLVSSLVGYGLLMLYQNYHTLADLLTTGVGVSLLIFPVGYVLFRPEKSSNETA
ncbi:hypothetical protein [Allohahella sp. A8]|uniref:hypothetical protein n=1 Tax=Allohahella sp. A8 TaxID=3141461 RepID=UPI003A80EDDA